VSILRTASPATVGEPAGTARPPEYRRRHLTAIAVFVVLTAVAGPLVGSTRSSQFLVNLWLVYSVAAVGFYWVFGLAGKFAFCQTFMMALGGYVSAWVTRSLGEGSFLVGMAAAIVSTAVVAGVVGLLVRRAQHFYFAIATFAVTQIGMTIFAHADAFTGPNGQTVGIEPASLFGFEFLRDESVFWLFLGVLTLCLVLAAFIERSPMRRDAIAARDNRTVAELAGVRATRVHVVLFMLGSALGGVSGALVGHWQGVIGADSFGIDLAIGLFLILLLGGQDSIWGPVIGSAIFVALPTLLSGIEAYGPIVYGVLLLVVVLALPRGIAGSVRVHLWPRIAAAANRWTRRKQEEHADAAS
jgi:branched-chain amino acid transport system permease protein